MYVIQVDHRRFDGYRDGTPFTLVSALRELRGTGNARVLRADGTVAVERAGSDTQLVHAPSGRVIDRRPRRRWRR